MFKELHYVDVTRVDRYLDQLSARKRGLLKWPSIEAKITWPIEIKGSTALEKNNSTFKKIDKLRKALEESDQLAFIRPDGDHIERPFVSETCTAYRVSIPSSADLSKPALSFWLSTVKVNKSKNIYLVLLEDFRASDKDPTSFFHTSSYSLLVSLVAHARNQVTSSLAGFDIPDAPYPNPYAKFGTDTHPETLSQWANAKGSLYDFIANPSTLFARWKCSISQERRIEAVYRVREWGPEAATSNEHVSIFGYPLWIISQ